MEWGIVGVNVLYAVIGVVLMAAGFRLFDYRAKKVQFEEELAKGNVAVGMVVGALFLAIAIIIAGALN